jgi:hypothetical protein
MRTIELRSQLTCREWLRSECRLNKADTLIVENLAQTLIVEGYKEDIYGGVELAAMQLERLMEQAQDKGDISLSLRIREAQNKLFGIDKPQRVENTINGEGISIQYVLPGPEQKQLGDGDDDKL